MTQSKPLKNYIRSARLRAGLTQEELAYLLGGRGGKLVSRYELFEREPSLQTALACEAALGAPVAELFSGLYQSSLETVQRRAGIMALQLKRKPASKMNDLKRRTINRILGLCSDPAKSPTP